MQVICKQLIDKVICDKAILANYSSNFECECYTSCDAE